LEKLGQLYQLINIHLEIDKLEQVILYKLY
jgi:hypothetical protein